MIFIIDQLKNRLFLYNSVPLLNHITKMKNLTIICLLSIFSIGAFAQNSEVDNKDPIFKFEAKEVDYGVVERD